MRIFVAGATGAVGQHLVPGLIAAGHEVTATTRSSDKAARLHEQGAAPVVVDGLDRPALLAAVKAAQPDAIVHQMTALASMKSLRKYGPGASAMMLDAIRKRRFPIVGGGAGVWSFTEITDAAAAAIAALHAGNPGVYNVVDDDPAPVAVWLPYLAECLRAKQPMHLPVWLGRLAAGEMVVAQMTQVRGSANDKAKRELDWLPKYPSWRDGFPVWVRA